MRSRSVIFILAYTCIVAIIFLVATFNISNQINPLQLRCHSLAERLQKTKENRDQLSSMVSSSQDPAAEEYGLITELGRIPEGYKKIIFENNKPEEPVK